MALGMYLEISPGICYGLLLELLPTSLQGFFRAFQGLLQKFLLRSIKVSSRISFTICFQNFFRSLSVQFPPHFFKNNHSSSWNERNSFRNVPSGPFKSTTRDSFIFFSRDPSGSYSWICSGIDPDFFQKGFEGNSPQIPSGIFPKVFQGIPSEIPSETPRGFPFFRNFSKLS